MNIGQIIKELRKEHSMSQSELAKKLYLSQDTVSLWETGKSFPDIPNLIKLTKIFNVTADYLLGIEK